MVGACSITASQEINTKPQLHSSACGLLQLGVVQFIVLGANTEEQNVWRSSVCL